MQTPDALDCLVVGAGQSGLMMAHLLAQAHLTYLVVDKATQCGGAWHDRPASLELFTPRRFSGLSPMPMPGNPNGYPNAREMAQYLMMYAKQAELDLHLGCVVQHIVLTPDGFFKVHVQGQDQPLYAKTVVDATGSNQVLNVPKWATLLPAHTVQLRPEHWEQAMSFERTKRVLVVGDGAWGRLIALELASHVQVTLACGKKRKLSPRRVLGRSIFCWLDWLGILRADKNSWVGKLLQKREPFPMAHANNRQLRSLGVQIRGRALGVNAAGQVEFSCGDVQNFEVVVWCAGYHENNRLLQSPISCQQLLLQGRGRCAEVPGFFVVGRKWLSCKASELVMGIEKDARRVLGYVQEHLQTRSQNPSLPVSLSPELPMLNNPQKTVEQDHA